jgi:hypothetical protein
MEIDRGHIAEGLMRPMEVVLHEPVSEAGIEAVTVSGKIPHLNKFLSQRAVESFVHRVVSRSLGTGEVMG